MPVNNRFTWDKNVDYWVDKFARDRPEAEIDDLRTFLKEGEPWKDFDSASDYFRHRGVIDKYPNFSGWFQLQQISDVHMKQTEIEERYESGRNTFGKLLDEWYIRKSDLEADRATMTPGEVAEASKWLSEAVDGILKQGDMLTDLSRGGHEAAQAFRKEYAFEIMQRTMAKELGDRVDSVSDDIKKRLKLETEKIRKVAEKITPAQTGDLARILEELAQLRMQMSGMVPGGVPVEVEPSPDRFEALKKARRQYADGKIADAMRTLQKAGFTALQTEAFREEWSRIPPGEAKEAGAKFDSGEFRRIIREEMERGVREASIEDYDVEWIQDPNNPDCWDLHTLSEGMRELAVKKLAAERGIGVVDLESMIADGRIPRVEFEEFVNRITPEEIIEMLVKPGRVNIIKRNYDFEGRLMGLPFHWGNGRYFQLSPEGRRHSGHASWIRLDTVCKVVEERMREGDWTYQLIRQAEIPRRFINQCIREVRKESAGA